MRRKQEIQPVRHQTGDADDDHRPERRVIQQQTKIPVLGCERSAVKGYTRAQLLNKALKACRKQFKHNKKKRSRLRKEGAQEVRREEEGQEEERPSTSRLVRAAPVCAPRSARSAQRRRMTRSATGVYISSARVQTERTRSALARVAGVYAAPAGGELCGSGRSNHYGEGMENEADRDDGRVHRRLHVLSCAAGERHGIGGTCRNSAHCVQVAPKTGEYARQGLRSNRRRAKEDTNWVPGPGAQKKFTTIVEEPVAEDVRRHERDRCAFGEGEGRIHGRQNGDGHQTRLPNCEQAGAKTVYESFCQNIGGFRGEMTANGTDRRTRLHRHARQEKGRPGHQGRNRHSAGAVRMRRRQRTRPNIGMGTGTLIELEGSVIGRSQEAQQTA